MTATLLHCPIRGRLGAKALAEDGLTETEEARRIDFLHFLLYERDYPAANTAVETVVLKGLGHDGKKQLRADVIVYDEPVDTCISKPFAEQLQHVCLVAEIKREAKMKRRGVERQLEPALLILPKGGRSASTGTTRIVTYTLRNSSPNLPNISKFTATP